MMQQGARLFGLALLVWLPVFLHEAMTRYPGSVLLADPVLTRAWVLAGAICCAIALPIAIAAARVSLRVEPRDRLATGGAALLLSSALVLALRKPLHQGVGALDAPPELALALLVLLAALAGAALVAGAASQPGLRHRPVALTSVALVAWTAALFSTFADPGPGVRLLLAASLVPVAALVWVRATAVRMGAAALALVLPAGVLVAFDRGTDPLLPEPEQGAPADALNVVVFTIDTLRSDHTGIAGYDLDTTPVLDAAARRRATVFRGATATASSTVPSVTALFTSQLPPGVRATGLRPAADTWTLAQAFRGAGYETAAFSANGLIDATGYGAGFQHFHSTLGYSHYMSSFVLLQLLTGGRELEVFRRVEPWRLHKTPGEHIATQALDWLAEERERPFFVYLHLVDPHWPYYAHDLGLLPPELADLSETYTLYELMRLPKAEPRSARRRGTPQLRELVARYDEEVRYADIVLGRVLQGLRALGLERSTLVVILSDHGEEFFEHNSFGHGHDVFENLVRVPLVFLWPDDPRFGAMPATVDPPVSLLDVFPTLWDYLALAPAPAALRGRSLRGLLERSSAPTPVVSEAFTTRAIVGGYREGPLKVRLRYRTDNPPLETRDVRVYDLGVDPRELRTLAPVGNSSREEVVRRARGVHQQIYERRKAERPRAPSGDPKEPEALRRLRDLGYLD